MLFEKGDKIVFIGDSISDFDRKRPVGEGLFGALGTSYVADIGALLECAYPEMCYRVVNMGIGGNRTRELRDRWQTDVIDLKPDWVSVLIGINDVWRRFDSPYRTEEHVPLDEFKRIYESLIRQTLPLVKGMILITPYFMEPNRADPMRAEMDRYGEVVRALATEYGCVFVDMQAAWDKLFLHMHPCNIAWDRIHPNHTGHMYIARQVLAAAGFDR